MSLIVRALFVAARTAAAKKAYETFVPADVRKDISDTTAEITGKAVEIASTFAKKAADKVVEIAVKHTPEEALDQILDNAQNITRQTPAAKKTVAKKPRAAKPKKS